MALRCVRLIKYVRYGSVSSGFTSIPLNCHVPISTITTKHSFSAVKEFKTESNIMYLEDPDIFGTLSKKTIRENKEEDEGDLREEKYLQELPLKSQKLTTRQYADIIKQYVKHGRIKEAIDVLEVRMLQEDRVKPENYIFNILIGACANVGYTKKAFKLYNDMKKRALKPTGDTYTLLFTACLNSPWITDGLKRARHLRAFMIEKGIEPNVTNYNVMIKTFGRCGDLTTAFEIVDEMISKKIKIRVHTFNHLLHACITDKDTGLRHALVVWRKMLKMREKPNIYSFNLMLKCIKDCNLGSKEDINDLIGILEEDMFLNIGNRNKPLQIESSLTENSSAQKYIMDSSNIVDEESNNSHRPISVTDNSNEGLSKLKNEDDKNITIKHELSVTKDKDKITMELVDYKKIPKTQTREVIPNLLSKTLQMDAVFALQDVHTLQDKFAVVGGQEEFLKEMKIYSVEPNIKLFTQMLPLIDESTEAEMKLIEAMQSAKVKPDIDFYNLLIRKRCLRLDYDKALEAKDMIEKERKKRHPLSKHRLKENIMTYGVLALACRTKDSAVKLVEEMTEKKIKINIQTLGTLLKNGIVNKQFGYIAYVMNIVKKEKVQVNQIFIQHLENFNDNCATIIKQNEDNGTVNEGFVFAYNRFLKYYKEWLIEVNAEEALKEEHPWQQFRESYPTTVQRGNFKLKEPKKFYKRNRKFVMYSPQVK